MGINLVQNLRLLEILSEWDTDSSDFISHGVKVIMQRWFFISNKIFKQEIFSPDGTWTLFCSFTFKRSNHGNIQRSARFFLPWNYISSTTRYIISKSIAKLKKNILASVSAEILWGWRSRKHMSYSLDCRCLCGRLMKIYGLKINGIKEWWLNSQY